MRTTACQKEFNQAQVLICTDRHIDNCHRWCAHACAATLLQVQASFLQQLLAALGGVREQAALVQDGVSFIDALPLPAVNRREVRVMYNDTACYSGPEARKVNPFSRCAGNVLMV